MATRPVEVNERRVIPQPQELQVAAVPRVLFDSVLWELHVEVQVVAQVGVVREEEWLDRVGRYVDLRVGVLRLWPQNVLVHVWVN